MSTLADEIARIAICDVEVPAGRCKCNPVWVSHWNALEYSKRLRLREEVRQARLAARQEPRA